MPNPTQALNAGELKRAKSRAKRLGVSIAPGGYNRKMARSLKRSLRVQRTSPVNIPDDPTAVNTVSGSSRKGRTYGVNWDPAKKRYFHQYGKGNGGAAQKVYIRKSNPLTKQYDSKYR